ncbi:MAG: flippase-like domain-containing protein [Candidatus Bathyarchaeota archaeon]|nr:flippase-like domain-containing protein [Candidatus Bathyarchaeota archaeon]MDH5635832.1 flippase-like domain-containing protein [Candidatus Bathyarchaeota archaeon]
MLSEKRMTIKRTVPFLLIGLLIFIAYLYFFVDIPEMLTIIQRVDLRYYLLAVAVLLLNMLAYSLTWQYFLQPLSINVPFRKTFLFSWIGVFVDLLIPAESISGDTSKAYLMTKESGENAGKVVASVVGHRILSMIITLSTLIISSISLFILQYELPAFVSNLILLVAIGTVISLIFIFLLCIREQLTQKLIDLLLRFFVFISRGRLKLTSLRSKARKTLSAFHQSIEVLGGNPRSLVRPVFFSIVAWFLSVLLSLLVFVSLGHPVGFVLVTIVTSISVSIQNIPLGVPGEVGLVEIAMTSLYIALLGPQAVSVAAAATVLIRVLTVWFRLLLGFVAIQWIGIKALIGGSR